MGGRPAPGRFFFSVTLPPGEGLGAGLGAGAPGAFGNGEGGDFFSKEALIFGGDDGWVMDSGGGSV